MKTVKRISLSDEDLSIWEKVSKTFDRHLNTTEERKSLKVSYAGEPNILSTSSLITKSGQTLNFSKDKKLGGASVIIRWNLDNLKV